MLLEYSGEWIPCSFTIVVVSDCACACFPFNRYVLRRILRRAVRYATEKLNAKPGMLASLVDTVCLILVSSEFFSVWACKFTDTLHMLRIHIWVISTNHSLPFVFVLEVVCRGHVMHRVLQLHLRGHTFRFWPFRLHVTFLGKLFTHMLKCTSVTKQYNLVVMLCG